MSEEVRMAQRDASHYNQPDTRSPKVYHVIISPPYVAACDGRVILNDHTESSLGATHPGLRCHRSGCWNRWAVSS